MGQFTNRCHAILFGEAQDQIANMDPTDNEHTTTPPDVTADEGEGAPVTPASPEQAEPTPVQRKRLLGQLRHFKDELSTHVLPRPVLPGNCSKQPPTHLPWLNLLHGVRG